MVYAFSKVFGPSASSDASAEAQIGSDYTIMPGDYHIKQILIGKGLVSNAEPCAGKVYLKITGVDGTYEYAYGNGLGGATNTSNMAAEKIDCSIPAPGGSKLQVFVKDVDNAADVMVSLMFHRGRGRRIDSYCVGVHSTYDTTADTEKDVGGGIVIDRAGRIVQIRFAGSGITDAKTGTGKLEISVPGDGMPHEFVVGNGPGGATLGMPADADVINIPGGIAVGKNVTVSILLTTAEVMIGPHCSISVA